MFPILGVLLLTAVHTLTAQELPQPEDPQDDATISYAGTAVIAKRAVTKTTAQSFNDNGVWRNLTNAVISYNFPVGAVRLFNVVFSGECAKANPGHVRIRVIDTAGVSPLQPDDGARVLCDAGNGTNTNTAVWVKRAFGGNHTLRVQIMKVGGGPAAVIDDWAFELVVHNP
jgi:hypothetical protein